MPFTLTQTTCIPLYYNHETGLTASGHISQSIVPLCPNCLVCKNKTQLYVYMTYFYRSIVKSVDMCKSESDGHTWTTWPLKLDWQLYWNISNCLFVLHNIPEEQRTHFHCGRNLISCMLLLVLCLVKRLAHFDKCQQ